MLIDRALLITDYNFYKQGRDFLTQLKQLSEGVNIFQKIFATVADSNNVWTTLLIEETLESHHQLIKVKNQALNPFHY